MAADSTPITTTAPKCPPLNRLLVSVIFAWNPAGNCSSYKPNMDSESSTNTAAKAERTQAFCSAADSRLPDSAAPMPIAV